MASSQRTYIERAFESLFPGICRQFGESKCLKNFKKKKKRTFVEKKTQFAKADIKVISILSGKCSLDDP